MFNFPFDVTCNYSSGHHVGKSQAKLVTQFEEMRENSIWIKIFLQSKQLLHNECHTKNSKKVFNYKNVFVVISQPLGLNLMRRNVSFHGITLQKKLNKFKEKFPLNKTQPYVKILQHQKQFTFTLSQILIRIWYEALRDNHPILSTITPTHTA